MELFPITFGVSYSESAVADRLGEALRCAAIRQLRVRVLMDAFGSNGLPAGWSAHLQAAGVQVRFFNPPRSPVPMQAQG